MLVQKHLVVVHELPVLLAFDQFRATELVEEWRTIQTENERMFEDYVMQNNTRASSLRDDIERATLLLETRKKCLLALRTERLALAGLLHVSRRNNVRRNKLVYSVTGMQATDVERGILALPHTRKHTSSTTVRFCMRAVVPEVRRSNTSEWERKVATAKQVHARLICRMKTKQRRDKSFARKFLLRKIETGVLSHDTLTGDMIAGNQQHRNLIGALIDVDENNRSD
jgi:hypothetical protein